MRRFSGVHRFLRIVFIARRNPYARNAAIALITGLMLYFVRFPIPVGIVGG